MTAGADPAEAVAGPKLSTALLHEAFIVPIARDGSIFAPGLRRSNGYWVGDKGSERIIATFEQALDFLRRMPVARWRRPNDAGNWGIVTGVEWASVVFVDGWPAEHA